MLPVWYGKSSEVDEYIRSTFLGDLNDLKAGRLDSWRGELLPCVAGIVLGDQLSRNACRDTAEMYAADPIALAWCKGLIADGSLNRLPLLMRNFATMPLVHSEDVADLEVGDLDASAGAWPRCVFVGGRYKGPGLGPAAVDRCEHAVGRLPSHEDPAWAGIQHQSGASTASGVRVHAASEPFTPVHARTHPLNPLPLPIQPPFFRS